MKNLTTINQKASYWIALEKEGFSPSEEKEFNTWLKTNTLHEEIFVKAKKTQNLFKNLSKKNSQQLSTYANKAAFRTKIIEKTKPLLMAAVFILSIGFAVFEVHDYYTPSYSKIYITNKNIIKTIKLPDNSLLSLDAKSQMQIDLFSHKREISLLYGRAMFNVAKDKNRVFTIQAGKTLIEVIGTKFEVNKEKNKTYVTVEEGKVKVSYILASGKNKSIVLLLKGETLSLNNNGKVEKYEKRDISSLASWRENLLIFKETSLNDAFKEFSRYKHFDILYKNNEIKDFLISGKFTKDEFQIFLTTLPKIYPIKITKYKNLIQISKIN